MDEIISSSSEKQAMKESESTQLGPKSGHLLSIELLLLEADGKLHPAT
jgi:hypothetical protein